MKLIVGVAAVLITLPSAVSAIEITVGWMEGVCYRPISNVRPVDILTFSYAGHDVWQMPSEVAMDDCDFSGAATQLAQVGDAPYEYTVTEQDAIEGSIYFACSIGAHCSQGKQRLKVNVEDAPSNEPDTERAVIPVSEYAVGLDDKTCQLYQSGTTGGDETADFLEQNRLQSECTDAKLGEDGLYHVSCLSGPSTLTPGGVINSARFMHYPYPTDRRVVIDTATWEFVKGDPIPNSGGMGVVPVPVNQLYVHHLAGSVILGQGSEGIRRSDVQIPFPEPYGTLTGDEGDAMIFHIIDLREVDEWLPCVECQCRDPEDGSYMNLNGTGQAVGGVSCCSNCTDLEGPTVDYRMRYNVSYYDIPKNGSITNIQMLTADISPAVGKVIEFDVPSYQYLKPNEVKFGYPRIQRLVREGPFNELFKMEFFGEAYAGPNKVKFMRCVGHLHIAALGMWLQDAETGMMICSGEGTYGQNPEQDKGFLTAIKVHSHDPPLEFPSDRRVRLITEYNATELHTGVMGMWFAFISSDVEVDRKAAALTVGYCEQDFCDADMLPSTPTFKCEDTLASHPLCSFGGVCDCAELETMEGSGGCGGVYSVPQGDVTIDNVCSKHCGACSDGGAAPMISSCVDTLAESPMCTFGGLCECEEYVNAPESSGCGGVYTSEWGNSNINEYCAKYCDACPEEGEGAQDMLIQKEILKTMENDVAKLCVFATEECSQALSNLHSCGTGDTLILADKNVAAVAKEHGVRIATEHSKLGAVSLHRDAKETIIKPCESTTSAEEVSEESSCGNTDSLFFCYFLFTLLTCYYF